MDLVQSLRNRVGRRGGCCDRAWAGFYQSGPLLRRRSRTPHKQFAPPLISGPPPKHAAQTQHQKTGNHREQDDIEILLKLAHLPSAPCRRRDYRAPGLGWMLTTWGAGGTTASALGMRLRSFSIAL